MDELPDFDWSMYGVLLRRERLKRGYKKAEDFSVFILERTNYSISKDVLYRIEQNRQEPTAIQLLAITIALGGSLLTDELSKKCLSEEWEYLVANKHFLGGYEDAQNAIQEWKDDMESGRTTNPAP